MCKNIFGVVFLAVCVILALLLVSRVISVVVSGLVFAVALTACGLLASRWYGRSARR
jgi:thiol:disulfide interchange protein